MWLFIYFFHYQSDKIFFIEFVAPPGAPLDPRVVGTECKPSFASGQWTEISGRRCDSFIPSVSWPLCRSLSVLSRVFCVILLGNSVWPIFFRCTVNTAVSGVPHRANYSLWAAAYMSTHFLLEPIRALIIKKTVAPRLSKTFLLSLACIPASRDTCHLKLMFNSSGVHSSRLVL